LPDYLGQHFCYLKNNLLRQINLRETSPCNVPKTPKKLQTANSKENNKTITNHTGSIKT